MGEQLNSDNLVKKKGTGTGFAVGGILAMLVTTASQAVYPTFSTRNDAISTLGGVGEPTSLVWNSAIVLTGLLWLLSTYKLFHNGGRKLSSVPFYLAGIGFLFVGLSPWNKYPVTHTIGALLVFFFGAISCLVAWRLTGKTIGKISLVSGVLPFLAFFGGVDGLDNLLGTGGAERMIYYPILLWAIAFGGYLLNLENNQSQ